MLAKRFMSALKSIGWRDMVLPGLVITATAAMWIAITFNIIAAFRVGSENALRDSANLARIVDAQVAGRIGTIDATLRFGQSLYASNPEEFRFGAWSRITPDGDMVNPFLVGPDGVAFADRNGKMATPIDLHDRSHVALQMAHPDEDRLEIGQLTVGAVSHRPVISFSRALHDGNGHFFAGVMILAVQTESFARMFQTLHLDHGRVALIGLDGMIRGRLPDVPLASLKVADDIMAPFATGTRVLSLRRERPIGGGDGFVTLRRLADYDLIVSASISADQALAGARQHRIDLLALGALLTVLILALTLAYIRASRIAGRARAALEGAFAHIGHGVVMTDPEGIVVIANDRMTELLGLPRGLAVPGRPVAEIIAWQDRRGDYAGTTTPRSDAERHAAAHHGGLLVMERTASSGAILEVRINYLEDGSEVRSWTDVTEARHAAAAIASARDTALSAEAALIAALEHVPHGVLLISTDRRILLINSAAIDLLNLPVNTSWVGRDSREIVQLQLARGDLEGRPGLTAVARDWTNARPQVLPVYERPTNDGRFIEVRTNLLPDGRTIRTYTDVSSRHAALREQKQARAAAETAMRSRNEFLAIASHELRTPLNAILGFSDLLLMQGLTPEQNADLQAIALSGTNLLRLVNDILDAAQLETGQLTLRERPLNFRTTLQAAVATMRPLADARALSLTLSIAADMPDSLIGDEPRLRQIFLKLLDNAIKFTRAGGVTLTAAMRDSCSESCILSVTVADTGIGITPEVQARIFEPFVQADTSNSRNYGGIGLGLAVCRMLLEAMGGTISVKSEIGTGSVFSFELKLRRPTQTGLTRVEPVPSF